MCVWVCVREKETKRDGVIVCYVDVSRQCDQMVRLFFNIWQSATMKIIPIMYRICKSRLNILPNKK